MTENNSTFTAFQRSGRFDDSLGRQRRLASWCTLAWIVVLAVVTCLPLPAVAAEWVIKRVSGQVYLVSPEVPAYRAKSGMPLQKGMTLATRKGARAMLARGSETILVGPSTTFALSRYRSQGDKTTLLQKSGTVTVDVAKRARPHFTVETPFLAAVVKGTRFEVKVGKKSAAVAVERGLVSVSDYASGDQADLGPGQRASTAPETKVGLTVGGKTKPAVRAGKKQAPTFQTPAVKNVPANSNAGKSANSSSNSNSSGNASSKSSSNANAASNSNSGGNGNGNSSNSNAGGNGNGNSGSSNAGGNGNGNSGNSNAGGNDNGNSGSSNAGGNGNGNSGNSNAGGNGNGNSGNSNAGGNGNGNGKNED